MMVKADMKAVDLFCGCGGLSLGLKQAQFRVIGAVDIDPLAVETYRINHRGVLVWAKDIRRVSPIHMMKRLGIAKGELDLLAGCPPCQGYSKIRTLNGKVNVEDPRNNLVLEFVRFVKELYPKYVMMENVPGLADDKRMEQVVIALDKMGYHCAIRIVNTAEFGVPQRRSRMILMANRKGRAIFAKPDPKRYTVRDTIFNLPRAGESGDPLHDLPERRSERILAMIRDIPPDGGSRRALGQERQLACHQNLSNGFNDIYGRMKWNDVAPTITGGCTNPSKGRFLHPIEHRAITLREAALLQTFPIDYLFSLRRGKGAAAIMIGNALPPEFIRRHARVLRRSSKVEILRRGLK